MRGERIEDFLFSSKLLIYNSLGNEAVENRVVKYGYTHEVLAEAKAKVDRLNQQIIFRDIKKAEKIGITKQIQTLRSALRYRHAEDKVVARVALKDDEGLRVSLQVNKPRIKNYPEWIAQVSAFYNNALSDEGAIAKLAAVGIDEARLLEGRDNVVRLEELYNLRIHKEGEAMAATKEVRALIRDLRVWRSDYIVICKIAFKDAPQLLEGLGINVKR